MVSGEGSWPVVSCGGDCCDVKERESRCHLTSASRCAGVWEDLREVLSSCCKEIRGWRRRDGGGDEGLPPGNDCGGGMRARLGRGGGLLGVLVGGVLTGTTTRGIPKGDTSGAGRLAKVVRGER